MTHYALEGSHGRATLLDGIRTILFRFARLRRRSLTYAELMNLSDRQLADIGLARGHIATVVLQGPAALRAIMPEEDFATSAVANTRPANESSLGAA